MLNIPVVPETPDESGAAAAIAERWHLGQEGAGPVPFILVRTAERLELRQQGPHAPGPVYVDFVGGAVGHRRRFGGGRGQPLAKAVGFGKGAPPSVIDATAGLGRDAFVLAGLGSEVSLIERSPVVAALLEDGLRRAAEDPEVAPIVARMHLHLGDARACLASMQADVVYLDPMYPHRDKSARVKKEMESFQQLVGEDADADELLAAALAAARQRVVVKRPDYAEPLAGRPPTVNYRTRKNRFDAYVKAAMGT